MSILVGEELLAINNVRGPEFDGIWTVIGLDVDSFKAESNGLKLWFEKPNVRGIMLLNIGGLELKRGNV